MGDCRVPLGTETRPVQRGCPGDRAESPTESQGGNSRHGARGPTHPSSGETEDSRPHGENSWARLWTLCACPTVDLFSLFLFFATGSCYVAQAGLELWAVLLPQPPKLGLQTCTAMPASPRTPGDLDSPSPWSWDFTCYGLGLNCSPNSHVGDLGDPAVCKSVGSQGGVYVVHVWGQLPGALQAWPGKLGLPPRPLFPLLSPLLSPSMRCSCMEPLATDEALKSVSRVHLPSMFGILSQQQESEPITTRAVRVGP